MKSYKINTYAIKRIYKIIGGALPYSHRDIFCYQINSPLSSFAKIAGYTLFKILCMIIF